MKTSIEKLLVAGQVVALAALVFLAVCVWLLSKNFAELQHQQVQHSEAIDSQLQQQSNAINRALGTAIPLKLPSDIEKRIDTIESVLATQSLWPSTEEGVKALDADLIAVVDALPRWAQEDVLPRLLPRRWEINGLGLLVMKQPDTLDDLRNFQQELDIQIEQRPAQTSEILFERLKTQNQKLDKTIHDLTRSTVRIAIEKGDLDRAAELLATLGDEDKELLDEFTDATALRQANRNLEKVQKMMALVSERVDTSVTASILGNFSNELTDLGIFLLEHPKLATSIRPKLDDLNKILGQRMVELRRQQNVKSQEIYRNYQIWALAEIKKVPKLSEIKKSLVDKIDGLVAKNNPLSTKSKEASTKAQNMLAQSMVEYLAPINQALLDVAVGQWFQKVYQDRFESLDDEHKLEVVEQFAITRKKSIDE